MIARSVGLHVTRVEHNSRLLVEEGGTEAFQRDCRELRSIHANLELWYTWPTSGKEIPDFLSSNLHIQPSQVTGVVVP